MARQQPGSAPPPSEAAPPAEDVIGLEHVTKRFDDVLAVRDATFGVRRGEFFSVLGPSGCGKTTTLRMVAGFEQPTAGRILLEGRDVSRVPPYRRSVNTVFQQYALFPHLSVYENVAFGPRSRRMAEDQISQRVGELLGVVRLEEMARRKPAQLSGGQQQRVALARALVNRPSALLLDEPLGALDLQLRQAMQGELKRIQREVGITFVHVTHDQEEALGLSDRIAVMHEGRVEQIGTPEEIYHAPATTFVASFIGSANLLPATVAAVHAGTATVVLVTGERVDLPAGNWGAHAGDRATVVVRPERLRLGAAAGPGAIPVTIQAIAFQGPVIRYTLRTRDGIELVARVGDGQDQMVLDLRPGRELYATWEAGAARLLPAAESGVGQP